MFSAVTGWYRSRQFEQVVLDWPAGNEGSPEGDASAARVAQLLSTNPELVLHEFPGRAGRLALGVAVEGGAVRLSKLLIEVRGCLVLGCAPSFGN